MKALNIHDQPAEPVSHNAAITKRVLLRFGEFGPITQFAQSTFPPGDGVAPHVHDDIGEVFLVDAGQGVIEVDGRRLDLRPGVCVAVEPGERHALHNTADEPLVLTYFGVKM